MDTEDFRAEIPRKILIVVGKLDLGGVEQHLLKTLPKLNQTGVFASVYTLRGGGRLDAQFERCGVKVGGPRFRLPGRLGLVPGGVGLLITLLCQRPDVVHFFLPEAYVVGGLLSRVSGARFHVMSRRSLNNYQRRYPWLPRVESWLHKRMDVIVGNSRAVISQLEQEGVERDKLMLLYNGLDVSPYRLDERKQKLRQGLDLEASSLILITVANLIPYKGHRNLLDALSYVRDKLPSGWVILMAGRDDGAGAALENHTRRLGLGSHVRWLGERLDVPDLLAVADIGIQPSHQEGFSNSILEGMASGLPMIVTEVGGNTEAVINGVTGLVVPVNQPRHLGVAIGDLADDPERRCRLGHAARKRVSSEFSIEGAVEKYRQLYARLGRCQEARSAAGE